MRRDRRYCDPDRCAGRRLHGRRCAPAPACRPTTSCSTRSSAVDPRRRQLVDPRVQVGRRHAVRRRPRRGPVRVGRRGHPLHRPRPELRRGHPRPRPPGDHRRASPRPRPDGTSYGAPTPREMKLAEAIAERVAELRAGAADELRHRGDEHRGAPGPRRTPGATGSSSSTATSTAPPTRCSPPAAAASPRSACPAPPACRPAPSPRRWSCRTTWCPQLDDAVAAVFVEPVAANMGVVAPAARASSQGLRAECDRVGALLVFDEVITGFRARHRRGAGEVRRPRPTSPRSARSSAAVCRSAPSAGAATSWRR